MTELSIKDRLYEPLKVDSRRGRGGTYDYVKWQNVADRMNEVFGMNWSSHVMSETIDEHNTIVVVRVSVCAKDPVSDESYCQEGYGASQLRSTDEPGSAHKGAYSKALKDACKKWGIGLHLEDGTTAAPAVIPSGYMGRETAPAVPIIPSTPPPAGVNTQTIPAPAAPTPVAPASAAPAPPAPPAPPASAAPAPASAAPAPASAAPVSVVAAPPVPPVAAPSAAPVAPVSSAPAPPAPPAPAPMNNELGPDSPGTINTVQEMAISNLARLGGIEDPEQLLTDLVAKADSGLDRDIKNIKDLSYTEAVKVIKVAKELS